MSNLSTKAKRLYLIYHKKELPKEKLLLEEAIVAAANEGVNTLTYRVSDIFIGQDLRRWLVVEHGFGATFCREKNELHIEW